MSKKITMTKMCLKKEGTDLKIMKRILTFVLSAAFVFSMISAASVYASEAVTAVPTEVTVVVDGTENVLSAFDIDGNLHFDLRDVANALSGTNARFNVRDFRQTYAREFNAETDEWVNILDEEGNYVPLNVAITIELGLDYAPVALALITLRNIPTYRENFGLGIRVFTGEYLDDGSPQLSFGGVLDTNGYVSNGVPLLPLWHLGMLLNFGVTWDSDTQAFLIDTSNDRRFTPEVREALVDFLTEFTSIFSFGVIEYSTGDFFTAVWRSDWHVGYMLHWLNNLEEPPLAYMVWEEVYNPYPGGGFSYPIGWVRFVTTFRGIFDQNGNEIVDPIFFQNNSIAVYYTLFDLDGEGIPEVFITFQNFESMRSRWSPTPIAITTVMYRFVDGGFQPVENSGELGMQFFLDNSGRLVVVQQRMFDGDFTNQAGDMIVGFFEATFDGLQANMVPLVGFYHRTDAIQVEHEYGWNYIFDVIIRNHVTGEDLHIGDMLSEWVYDWGQVRGNYIPTMPGRTLMPIPVLMDLQQEIAQTVLQRLAIER